MLEFGSLEIVEKTFTRTAGAVRGQNYTGLKFRRATSNKNEVEAIDEKFTFSNEAFEKLNLDNLALTQAKINGQVLLLVLEDIEGAVPPAKFVKQSVKKDGTPQKKGKFFNNDFLVSDLVSVGVLKPEVHGNQYLALTDVTAEITGLPAHIKAVYAISIDTTVDASKDVEEAEETETAETTQF